MSFGYFYEKDDIVILFADVVIITLDEEGIDKRKFERFHILLSNVRQKLNSFHHSSTTFCRMATFECCLKVKTSTGHFRASYFHGFTQLIYSTHNPLYFTLVRHAQTCLPTHTCLSRYRYMYILGVSIK